MSKKFDDTKPMSGEKMRFRTRTGLPSVEPGGIILPGTIITREHLAPEAQIDRLMREGALEEVSAGGVVLPHAEVLADLPSPKLPDSLKPIAPVPH